MENKKKTWYKSVWLKFFGIITVFAEFFGALNDGTSIWDRFFNSKINHQPESENILPLVEKKIEFGDNGVYIEGNQTTNLSTPRQSSTSDKAIKDLTKKVEELKGMFNQIDKAKEGIIGTPSDKISIEKDSKNNIETLYTKEVQIVVNTYAKLSSEYIESVNILDMGQTKEKICRLFIEEGNTIIYWVKSEETEKSYTAQAEGLSNYLKKLKERNNNLKIVCQITDLISITHHKTEQYYEGTFSVKMESKTLENNIEITSAKQTIIRTHMKIHNKEPQVKIVHWNVIPS